MEKCNKPSVPISLMIYSPMDKRLKRAATQLRATATTMLNKKTNKMSSILLLFTFQIELALVASKR
jgi:hypothetical protein